MAYNGAYTSPQSLNSELMITCCHHYKEWGENVYYLKLFVAFPWVITSSGPGGFMICVFIL